MYRQALVMGTLSLGCAERVNAVAVTLSATQSLHELYFWKFPRCDGHKRSVLAPAAWLALMDALTPAQRIKLTHVVGALVRAGYRDLGGLAEAVASHALVGTRGLSRVGVAFAEAAFRRPLVEAAAPEASADVLGADAEGEGV